MPASPARIHEARVLAAAGPHRRWHRTPSSPRAPFGRFARDVEEALVQPIALRRQSTENLAHPLPHPRRLRRKHGRGVGWLRHPAPRTDFRLELTSGPPGVAGEDSRPEAAAPLGEHLPDVVRIGSEVNLAEDRLRPGTARSVRTSESTAPGCTGPPQDTCRSMPLVPARTSSALSTLRSVGRFSTTPNEPSELCSRTSTTVCAKVGSGRPGIAYKSTPRFNAATRSCCGGAGAPLRTMHATRPGRACLMIDRPA